jgi:hypothetical protein
MTYPKQKERTANLRPLKSWLRSKWAKRLPCQREKKRKEKRDKG